MSVRRRRGALSLLHACPARDAEGKIVVKNASSDPHSVDFEPRQVEAIITSEWQHAFA
jgi:hypothetical protein